MRIFQQKIRCPLLCKSRNRRRQMSLFGAVVSQKASAKQHVLAAVAEQWMTTGQRSTHTIESRSSWDGAGNPNRSIDEDDKQQPSALSGFWVPCCYSPWCPARGRASPGWCAGGVRSAPAGVFATPSAPLRPRSARFPPPSPTSAPLVGVGLS